MAPNAITRIAGNLAANVTTALHAYLSTFVNSLFTRVCSEEERVEI